ncbi:MAG: hypothetical protein MUO64_09940 [Anaerolineales bacterium]|nr:hypothetical protein [Anaerolineales bacterium]
MDRVQFLSHNDKQIVLLDLSHCQTIERIPLIEQAKIVIAGLPPKSSLVLTDVTEGVYTKDVDNAIKDFVSHNTPYIKASAVVGADGIRLVLLQTVIFLTRREIKTCKTRHEAMDWLAGH